MSAHSALTDPNIHEIKGASTALAGQVPTATGLGTAVFQTPSNSPSGSIIQSLKSLVVSTSTGTTLIPYDNTIPQNTEGTQFFSASITPGAIGNKIRIHVILTGSYSVASPVIVALFQDTTANALAADAIQTTTTNQILTTSLMYEYTTASLSPTTFYIRVGGSTAGTFTLNGNAGAALFGGVATSVLTVSEIKA